MSLRKEFRCLLQDTSRLFRLTWQAKRRLLVFAGVAIAIVSVCPFIQNFALGRLLSELVSSSKAFSLSDDAAVYLSLMLAAGVAFSVSNVLQFFFKTVLYKELFQFLSVMIHQRTADLDVRIHEDPEKKDQITKVQENAMWRAPEFMQRFAYLVQNLLEVVFAVVILLLASWEFGALLVLASLPRLLIDLRYNHRLWEVETKVAETRRKFWYARWFVLDLRALVEVKLFQNVAYFVRLIDKHLGSIKALEIDAERQNLGAQLRALIYSELASIALVVNFVLQAAHGKIDVGTLAFYLSSLAVFRVALNSLSQNIGSQFKDAKFVRDMFEVFDLGADARESLTVKRVDSLSVAPVLLEQHHSAACLEQIEEIVFEDVSFAYPRTERMILKDFNLTIHGGETLGIVAENGSGKSTMAKLLCRMYEPTYGRILVNGRDIREYDIEHWRSKVGVMLQEFQHYEHLDIRSAIQLGRIDREVTQDELQSAVRFSEASEFIETLPLKFDTTLGRYFENGVELSGGQYQMLAIARLGFRQPQLAIFDEPTSAIDGEREARIFERILNGLPGTTKILISHRFYTLRKADRICLIKGGQVFEYGTHLELMQRGGLYSERYQAQASEYDY